MAEATYEFLTLGREGDHPEIGELREGEVVVNIVDGRLWIGDAFSIPLELGGNAQEHLISEGGRSNYISIEVSSPGVFPIELPDPNEVVPGTYRELTLHLWYPAEYEIPGSDPVAHVTYPVEWDQDSQPLDEEDSPFITLRGANRHVVFKLFAFGPRQFWFGKVIWVSR